MKEKRFGYFPRSFVWRGKTHVVLRCERCWTVSRPGLRGRTERLYFRVRCAPPTPGVCDVYQNLLNNTWHIERFVPDARAWSHPADWAAARMQ